jgi:hypothetical protein
MREGALKIETVSSEGGMCVYRVLTNPSSVVRQTTLSI